MTNLKTKMERVNHFRDTAFDAVKFAMADETTESISQALGALMVRHQDAWIDVPYCLIGCIDEIYAENLRRLGQIAQDEVLKSAINAEYEHVKQRMSERAKERASSSENGMKRGCIKPNDILEA